MDLREFLRLVKATGELKEIATEVSSDQEIAAICRREFASGSGGKVLLFKHVKGSSYPVVANLFGSEARVSELLYSNSFADFATQMQRFLAKRSGSASKRFDCSSRLIINNSTQQLTTKEIKLIDLPAIISWPQEQNGYLNLALAVSESPEDGNRNLGLYRGQIIDDCHLALNFSSGSGLANHLRQAKIKQQKLPVSLILGAEPALIWLASAPLPLNCDEFALYTELFSKKLQITAGKTNSIQTPANAEFIIEGFITPDDTITEGPFGNHSGQYVSRADCPVLEVKSVRARADAIFPTTVVGTPPSENIFLAQANGILIKQMIKIDYPQIVDIHMPLETIFHGVAFLSLKAQNGVNAKDLIYSLWKNSPLSRSKLLILLDADIDLKSASKCWWRTINQMNAQKIYQSNGRMAIDATGVDPALILTEDQQTVDLLQQRYGAISYE